MKALSFALKSLRRELRSGEVLVLLAAVTLAVAALTAVGFLTDRIGKAVARQANEVLAADLRLRSQEPIPDTWRSLAADYELRTADMASFPSVVYRGDDNALSTLVAVGDGYPLRGTVRIADRLFGDEQTAAGIPEVGTVWADGTLMARLGAEVGDVLEVGSARFPIAAVVTYRPDQSVGFASFAPRLLMNVADLPSTELIGVGSRVTYALLVAGADDAVEDFAAAIEPELPDSLRLRSAEESSERAFAAADRAQRFLSLTAVISLLLSAVAIAMSARRFALRRMDPVALMKSLGATQDFVIGVATVQILLIGLIGVVVGCVVGFAVESAVSWVLADIISGDLPPAGLRPVVLACGSALLLLAGFALPSLIRLRNTPPLRVLRHDAMPPAPSRILVAGASLIAVAGLLYQSVGDAELLVYVLGGIILISAVLYLLGRGLVAALALGAEGVNMGTRFLATQECQIHANVKDKIVASTERDTNLIFRNLHNTARVGKNSVSDEVVDLLSRPDAEFQDVAHLVAGARGKNVMEGGDLDNGLYWAGMAQGLIHDVPTVADLIGLIMDEARGIAAQRLPALLA